MDGGTILKNKADYSGGGVYIDGGNFYKTGGIIYGSGENANSAQSGNAVYYNGTQYNNTSDTGDKTFYPKG